MGEFSPLVWDQTGEKFYETGVKNGVLYVQHTDGTYPKGVAWNGLTAVTESPSGAEQAGGRSPGRRYHLAGLCIQQYALHGGLRGPAGSLFRG